MFGFESRRFEFGGSLLVSPASFPQLPLQPKQIQGLKFISGVNSKYLGTVVLCVCRRGKSGRAECLAVAALHTVLCPDFQEFPSPVVLSAVS